LKHALDHYGLDGFYTAAYNGKGQLEREAEIFATQLMLLLYQEQYEAIPETFDVFQSVYGIKEEMREII
jgi:toxin-antitoxin system, toxin component